MTDREEQRKEAAALYERAHEEYYAGRLRDARTHLMQVQVVFTELEDYEMLAKTHNLLGVVYAAQGSAAQAIDSYILGINCARKHGFPYTELVSLNNLGSHYMEIEEYDCALTFFEECCKSAGRLDEGVYPQIGMLKRILAENMALLHLKLGHLAEAESYLAEAEKNLVDKDVQNYDVLLLRQMLLYKKGFVQEVRESLPALEKALMGVLEPADFLTRIQEYISLLKEAGATDYWERIVTFYYEKMAEYHNTGIRISVLELYLDYAREMHLEQKYAELCVQYVDALHDMKEEKNRERREIADVKLALYRKEQEQQAALQEKQKLQQLAETDTLTGLGSRYSLRRYGRELLEQAETEHTTLVLGLIDVDQFKQYNDAWGHMAGDNCLIQVAAVLRKTMEDAAQQGACGRVFRYGGDELMVVMTVKHTENVNRFAEGMKAGVRALKLSHPRTVQGVVTVSQGYFCGVPCEGGQLEHFLERADALLYQVKETGRDSYLIEADA